MNISADSDPDRDALEQAEKVLLETLHGVVQELHRSRSAPVEGGLDAALDRDFGLDSLSRVELGARLERAFDVALDEQRVFDANTPRDLLGLILKARSGGPLTLRTRAAGATRSQAGLALPERAETLHEVLHWHAERNGDRAHIRLYDDYSDGEVITYAALWAGASKIASNLQSLNLQPGSCVALMLPTGRAYFTCFFGVLLAGGVPVPIYPPARRQQLEDHLRRQGTILNNCRASLLITTLEARSMARLLSASVASLNGVLAAEELEHSPAQPLERSYAQTGDTAFVQYTSGSTGDPKGVVLSHANLLANIRADGLGMGVSADDVFVSWLPLYHDMGLIGAWLGSLYHGVQLVVMSPLSFLARPERWLWAIHRHGGTLSAAPNFAYELCLKRCRDEDLQGLDLSGWRIAANGAEAISASTLEAFCERFETYGFRRTSMFPVYGLAECSVGLTFTPLGRGPRIETIAGDVLGKTGRALDASSAPDEHTLELVSCGLPLFQHEIRVVDEQSRELPARQEGRLQFRGPSATSGYLGRPDATAALFDGDWLETGDRGFIDAGELFITGRSKDIIIRAGRNIYPADLEDAIGNLEGVRKGHIAAFGVHDEHTGTERLVIMAETRKRNEASRDRLRADIDSVVTRLIDAPADEVALVAPNSVLRTSSGKVRRAASRDVLLSGAVDQDKRPLWSQLVRLAALGMLPQLRRLAQRCLQVFYAAWAWCAFSGAALVCWTASWLPLPRRALWSVARSSARLAATLSALPIETSGLENLPPPGTAVTIVSNHQSYLDGLVLTAALPRPVCFVVKGELGQSKLLALPLRRLGAVFVERFDARAGIASMGAAVEGLERGETLVIFPEGTFKRMPGLLPFHLGAFVIAADHGSPLVPLAIRGTRSILRADSWFPRRGRIAIEIGAPLSCRPDEDRWSRVLALRDGARAELLDRCAEPDLERESNAVDQPGN